MKLVILDRDGVINEDSDDYIKSADEWLPIAGSIEAISALHRSGFTVAVATNQSAIGRGLIDEYELAKIHQKMSSLVEVAGGFIEGVFFCPHTPEENCNCRKPKTGLLSAIALEFDVSLIGVPFVGDSRKDIEAAKAVKCKAILVKTGKGLDTLASMSAKEKEDVVVVNNLKDAVDLILESCDPCVN